MLDPKHLEMKKHLLMGLKNEGRQRHAMKLKHRFAPPEPPPAHEDVPTPAADGMDASGAPAQSGGEGSLTKEELAELLARLQ